LWEGGGALNPYPDYDSPDAIILSDLHIRASTPRCRTDDFIRAQQNKYDWIHGLRTHFNDPPILCAGDIFNKWNPTPYEISLALEWIPKGTICVPGNHDLPAHNIERIEKSGLYALWMADHVILPIPGRNTGITLDDHPFTIGGFDVFCFPFKEPFKPAPKWGGPRKKIALVHHFVYKGRKPFPGADTGVSSLMKNLPGYDLIITGDNHIPFDHIQGDQILLNPGSITRTSAAQIEHIPRVYLWWAEENAFEWIPIPVEGNVISREHIEEVEIRDQRISAFIEKLGGDGIVDIEMSFERNVKNFLSREKITPIVKKKIQYAMEEGGE
jgi:predicted phosphodiesterase